MSPGPFNLVQVVGEPGYDGFQEFGINYFIRSN